MELQKMIDAMKKGHSECATMTADDAISFYKRTYENVDSSANEKAWHFTAFRMAFLDDK